MTYLKLQIGDFDGSLQWVTMDLSDEQFNKLTDEQVMEQYLVPAMRQLVWHARTAEEKRARLTAKV